MDLSAIVVVSNIALDDEGIPTAAAFEVKGPFLPAALAQQIATHYFVLALARGEVLDYEDDLETATSLPVAVDAGAESVIVTFNCSDLH